MAKKIDGYIKLEAPAAQASPSQKIGTALGPKGVNIMEFCKAFNAATQAMTPGMPVPVIITVYADRSFTFVTKSPPASYLLKKAAGIEKGTPEAGKKVVGRVTMEQVREIARTKMVDLNSEDLEAATRIVAGSARSMGIEVTE